MSAYGKIIGTNVPKGQLVPRTFALPSNTAALTVFPTTKATCPDELLHYLSDVYAGVVAEGRTYPAQTTSYDEFVAYFFAGDCFLGVHDELTPEVEAAGEAGLDRPADYSLERVRAQREWRDVVLGFYYIKPNYPGRASHNCNGGFIVPPVHRGLKVGLTLGRSYLHFAPILAFRGSVFNLVFVNNIGSLRIWDRLGFTRAGLIPNAALLKTVDGQGQEYVDAVVYYKDLTTSSA